MIEPDINERMMRFAPSQQQPDVDPIAAEIASQAMMPSAQPTTQPLPDVDPVARDIAERSRENLNAAVLGARAVNPDEAAKAIGLGRKIGIPPEVARADIGRAEQQAYLMDLRSKDFERTDPIMANFLANKEFAEVAHDDVGVLDAIRPIMQDWAMLYWTGATPGMRRGFERGQLVAERGDIGAKAMTGFAGPEDFDRAKQVELRMRELTDIGFLGATTEVIAQNLAQLRGIGTATVGGAAIGSVVPVIGTIGGGALGATAGVMATTAQMEAGNLYLDLREQGVSDDTAIPTAIAGGYLNGIIEVVGMKIAAKPFQALAKRMLAESVAKAVAQPTVRAALATAGKGYLMQVGSEATEEALQEVVIIAGEEIAKAIDNVDTETSMAQAMDRVVDAFTQGAMGAAILGGIGPGANLYVDMRRAATTQRQQDFFQRLSETSKESRLAQRSPDAYERFLEAQAKGGPAETIYVDARVAQQVFAQSGLTPQQLEEVLPGIRAQVETEVATGGDVTIQTARFGARLANTDLGNSLLPHMRLDPDAMSVTEAQEWNAKRQETVREAEQILAQKQEADGAFVAEARDIEDTLAAQIVATGQMDEKAARTSAQFMRDFYVTQAAALGITPRQVYERFPVRVEGAMAPAAMEQAARIDGRLLQKKVREYAKQKISAEELIAEANIEGLVTPEEVEALLDEEMALEEAGATRRGGGTSSYGVLGPKGKNPLLQLVQDRLKARQAAPGVMEQAATVDAEYMAAVERGDMETAQRMVDEAARSVGLTELVWRGDRAGAAITQYRRGARREPGIFTTTTQEIADKYAGGAGLARQFYVGGRTLDLTTPTAETVQWIRQWAADAEWDFVDRTTGEQIAPEDAVMSGLLFDWEGTMSGARWKDIQATAAEQGYDIVKLIDMDEQTFVSTVVLNENRIKSADPVTRDEAGNVVPLSRRFDITSPRIFEQAPVAPGFYSALEREVAAIDAKALTASGWGERFKGLISKGAIKADELEWSGLADYLKMQEGKVSKDAVLEFLRGNGVRVERVGLSDPLGADIKQARINDAEREFASRLMEYAGFSEEDAAIEIRSALGQRPQRWADARIQAAADALFEAQFAPLPLAKYEQYTLPGGTNYREVLLTLPREIEGLGTIEQLPNGLYRVSYPRLTDETVGTRAEAERILQARRVLYGKDEERTFRSKHWDQPNVLVHLRMNDRVDADGKRVLFVEEVQSDWGQAGKKKGFLNPALREQRIAELERIKSEAEKAAEPYTSVGQDAPPNILETWNAAANELTRIQRETDLVPRAPFVETTDGWLNLGLKQVLLEAVRGNYDRVAFVTGQQSADRYDLSKQVDRIVVSPRAGLKSVNIELKAGNILSYGVDANGIISETTEESMRIAGAGTPLENVIGKELAEKIMQTERGTFEGVDLKVGGKGMIEFYDKIVPIAMGKLLKKYGGGKIGMIALERVAKKKIASRADIREAGREYFRGDLDAAEFLEQTELTGLFTEEEIDTMLEDGIGGDPARRSQVRKAVMDDFIQRAEFRASAQQANEQPGFDVTPELVKKLESGLPLFQAAAGPARGGFDPKRLTTILTKTADLSTFLHESAHAFLTFYEQVAATPDAPARIVSDMDELLRWFKIDGATPAERLAKWNGLTLDQKRQYHETFAYNFEVYLFEGKAPSVEMQGLFERFSVWLKRVYRSIRDDLNAIYRREFGEDLPILTGEVRQVMDRMLATDKQIRRQAAINEMKPMFQSQEQSGMDDAEWAAYQAMQQEAIEAAVTDMNKASLRQMQWLGNARSRIMKDIQRKHDRQRKEVSAEVAAAVRVEPVYRAMTYLRTGRFIDADGAEVEVEGPHRLDTKRVKAIYETVPTAESLKPLRATGMPLPTVVQPNLAKLGTGSGGMMGLDGLDPDLVAETFGYSSGDELIRALVAARPIKEEVAARTDAEMLRRYGDMNTPEAVEAEVQAALHNEARARFVAVELRHIARATEPVRVMLDAAKQVARELIAGRRVRDVRPSDFVAAEARAARDATRIGAPTNPVAIGQAAYTRTYNQRIADGADEATAIAEATTAGAGAARMAQERADALKAQYGAEPQQALIRAKRAQLYQNQLAAEALRVQEEVAKAVKYLRRVLRDENVKRMGAPAADQIAGLLERYEVAPVSLKRLDERRALAEWLAAQEAAGLVPDIAPEIANEARRINYREVKVSEFRDLVDAVKQIEFVGKNERKLQLAEERAAFEETRDEIVTRIRAVAKVRGLDVDPRSPLTNIGRTAAALRGFAAQHLKAASVARILDGGKDDGPLWNAIIRTANAAADMETTMRAEASAKLAEILGPVFKLGNMGGKGIYFPSIDRALNREARIAIALNVGNDGNRQRLLDGEGWTMEQIQPVLESLTEAEWQAVQRVWDYIDTYRPLIAEKERRLYGKTPEWVEAVPMTVRTADGKVVNLTGGYYPIKYDPVASDRVATIDEVAEAKRAMDGAYTAATTRRSFVKARAKEVVDRPLLYTLDAAFSGVNDVIHDLAWHEWLIGTNRLLRDTEFANAVRETRGPEFLKQLRDWAKDNAAGERKQQVAGEGALSWLRQGISASGLGFNVVSAIMQVTGFNQSIVRVGAKYVGRGIAQFAGSPIDTARMVAEKSQFMAERGRTQFRELNEIKNRVRGQTEVARRVTAGTYFLMMNMQRTVDVPTWLGAYQKALDAGKDDARAVALADQAVRDSQGSGLISDLAAIERGGPMMKLFTVFYSYMNTVYNMTAVQTYTARGRGKLAADYVMLLVVPVVLGQAIKNLVQPDADDEEFDPEALARKLAAEELSYLMGTMVIAREFGGAAQLLTGAEGVRMGYGGPAGLRAVGEVYGLATQAGQLEFDRAFRRSAINTLGAFTGLPSAQINRTIDGIEAVVEGEVTGVGAVAAPFTGVQR